MNRDPMGVQIAAAEAAIDIQRCWFDDEAVKRQLGPEGALTLQMAANYGYKKLDIRVETGVYEHTLGQPQRLRPNCINCGAPGEAVCSYCGTQGGTR